MPNHTTTVTAAYSPFPSSMTVQSKPFNGRVPVDYEREATALHDTLRDVLPSSTYLALARQLAAAVAADTQED